MKPNGSVLTNPPHGSEKSGERNEEPDPQTSHAPSAQPNGIDPSTSKKKKGIKIQQLYQPQIPFP
jgi:hypothetical protein